MFVFEIYTINVHVLVLTEIFNSNLKLHLAYLPNFFPFEPEY